MALQTLEGDLIPMRPAKETLTRYAVLLLGAAILSFGLFNVHSQSGVTEGGVLGTTLLLHHWFGISPGVSEFVIDVICYALGFRFLGKAFLKYAIAARAGFARPFRPTAACRAAGRSVRGRWRGPCCTCGRRVRR